MTAFVASTAGPIPPVSHTAVGSEMSTTVASTPRSASNINPNVVKRVHREVRFGNYILGSTLGEGEFGKVKLGWRKDGKHPSQVAIKLIKRASIQKDSDSEVKIHREINSLKLLNHPNIVNLVEVMKSGKYIGIVLEYASGGELFDYILHHKYLKENVAKKLFAQLVSGVDYMHSKGLIHRDLKLENLLLDKHKNVIITDFGFVNSYNKDKNDLMKTSCGSPCYAAPELVLTQSPYEGRKVDIWSLGVILYAMLSGYLPFDDDPENEDGSDIVRLYRYICKTPLTFPEYVSPLARDLLRKIIVPDPKKRININDIRNHTWLSPYANLLSIRQPEWDRIHKEKDMSAAVTAATASASSSNSQKRFSMINERTNSSALMIASSSSGSSHGRSYSSTSISQLYSSPSISSSLANAVALPKLNTNMTAMNTAELSTSTRSSPSPTKSSRGHTKSASISNTYPTASNALKAVVNDNNSRTSVSSVDSLIQPIFNPNPPPTTSKGNYHIFPNPAVSRSTTYTGTAISTIIESPTKTAQEGEHTIGLLPTTPVAPLSASTASSRDSNRLPHTHKKPRPTSYHPSSMTSTLISGNNSGSSVLFDYMKMPSPINVPMPQFLSTSPTKSSPISVTSSEVASSCSSPVGRSPRTGSNSRRNSVVTHVHVNGVLSNENTSNVNNGSPDAANKRNSVLSYLEDKIDTLELKELFNTSQLEKQKESHETTITPQINQLPTFDTQLSPSVNDVPVSQEAVQEVAPASKSKESLPENASDVEMILEKMKKSEGTVQMVQEKSQETVDSIISPAAIARRESARETSRHEHRNSSEVRLNKRDSISRDHREANKENKEQKKRNRFSILSFYSTYNSSSSNLSSMHSNTNNNLKTGHKKVLEPSTEANISSQNHSKDQKRINSSSSSQSKRSSISTSTATSSANAKEASAARKVMDFFKRRSVRIG